MAYPLLRNPEYWLNRLIQKRTGFPAATLAYYGPDEDRASKAVVCIVPFDGSDIGEMQKWFSDAADVRKDAGILSDILGFLKEHRVVRVTALDRMLGCPHEEGIDYPDGEVCPECPYWAGIDRWTGKPLRRSAPDPDGPPSCGLCGKRDKLTRTECCGNWICDDVDQYVPFSYERNSCYRNHDNYTVCAYHHHEGHAGDWKTCAECRETWETELYVANATNEYNFETLPKPPSYKPTHCQKCGAVIRLAEDGYMMSGKGYTCLKCSSLPKGVGAIGRGRR